MAQPVSDALALIVSIFFVVREQRILYSLSDNPVQAGSMAS